MSKLDGTEEKYVIIESLRRQVYAGKVTLNTAWRTAINTHKNYSEIGSGMERWWQEEGILSFHHDTEISEQSDSEVVNKE